MSSHYLDRKRHRSHGSSNEDGNDSETNRHHSGELKSTQAERKRELERNRRHVINVRFAELDAELRRSAPRADGQPINEENASDNSKIASVRGRRIDKEAVLKEAIQRLALKENDLKTITARLDAMSTEIHNLRAEKVELREDKTYLRGELETLRAETKRLRAHNVQLLHAISKMSALKMNHSSDSANLHGDTFNLAKPSTTPVKPACQATTPPTTTVPTASPVVRNLSTHSSQPALQTSTPNRDDVISPLPDKPSSDLLHTAMTDHHPAQTSSKSPHIETPPTSDSILSQDLFSFQTSEDFTDLFASFSHSYFDDIPNSNPVGNEGQVCSIPFTQSLTHSQSSPSPEVTRAATIAAATIAARAQNSSAQHAPVPNGADVAPMVVSLPADSNSHPAAFQNVAANQTQSLGLHPAPTPESSPFIRNGNPTTGSTNGNNNNTRLANNRKPNGGPLSDVAYCV